MPDFNCSAGGSSSCGVIHYTMPDDVTTSAPETTDLLSRVEDVMFNMLTASESSSVSTDAALYHLNSGGKRTRAVLSLECSQALCLPCNTALHLAAAVELLHNASLVHDDFQDGDPYRRNRKAVWKHYSRDIALCTGDLMISAAYACIGDADTPYLGSLLKLHHQAVATTIHGQSLDTSVAGGPVTLNDYNRIVTAKSSPLIALCFQAPLLCSNDSISAQHMKVAAEAFTLGYQIADDIEDIHVDVERPDREARPNIFHLMRKLHSVDPLSSAIDMAIDSLTKSIEIAENAPNNCGRSLVLLAVELSRRLTLQEFKISA